ncbi:alpha-ketoglutarate dehydrogenase component 4-like [Molossus nigricans]
MMSSMMASASRIMQVVRPHILLTRFPDRRDNPKTNMLEVLSSAGLPSHSFSTSQQCKGSKLPDWLMYQGPPNTAEIINILPQRHKKKLVSQEEIQFIQCGGLTMWLLFIIRQKNNLYHKGLPK